MREVIEDFCDEIKVDYSLFLYNHKVPCKYGNKKEYLEFPFCCKVSANIITSFLQMNFGEDFRYMCTTRGIVPHGWTVYNNRDEYFIIDFTNFQFDMSDDEKIMWRKREKTKKQIIDVIQHHHPVQDYSIYDEIKDIVLPKERKCIGEISKYNVEFTKNSFFEYVKNIIDNVYLNTDYTLN